MIVFYYIEIELYLSDHKNLNRYTSSFSFSSISFRNVGVDIFGRYVCTVRSQNSSKYHWQLMLIAKYNILTSANT